MKIVITAGGTGGHIYPALSIIEKIKKENPSAEFLYIGNSKRMESEIVPNKNIPFLGIEMVGFVRSEKLKNLKIIPLVIKNYFLIKKSLKKFKPDLVFGFGGYVTFPVVLAAKRLKVKIFLHEQNSIPGKSNKVLSGFADKIFVSFEDSIKYFKSDNIVISGNPIASSAILQKPATKKEFGIKNKKLVLIVMGSLGSSKVNEILIKNLKKASSEYDVLFVTGKNNYKQVSKKKFASNIHVVPYIDDIARVFKISDLIITRAGASTLSEIIALKKPSIIIPSPYVVDDHQTKNALSLASKDAAILLPESNMDSLFEVVNALISDDNRLEKLSENLGSMGLNDASEIIYKYIGEL